jgi:homoserine dehydrogenase
MSLASGSSCWCSHSGRRQGSSSAYIRPWCRNRPRLHGSTACLNAVAVDGDYVGEIVLVGPGAGGNATASSVVADITDIARGDETPVLGMPAGDLKDRTSGRGCACTKVATTSGLSVYDRPGAFAEIARCMGDAGISLESIVQKRHAADESTCDI